MCCSLLDESLIQLNIGTGTTKGSVADHRSQVTHANNEREERRQLKLLTERSQSLL